MSRESRVGGELKGADEESRALAAGCALKSRFWCTTQQKVRLKLAFLTLQKRPKSAFFKKALPCRMPVSSERNKGR